VIRHDKAGEKARIMTPTNGTYVWSSVTHALRNS